MEAINKKNFLYYDKLVFLQKLKHAKQISLFPTIMQKEVQKYISLDEKFFNEDMEYKHNVSEQHQRFKFKKMDHKELNIQFPSELKIQFNLSHKIQDIENNEINYCRNISQSMFEQPNIHSDYYDLINKNFLKENSVFVKKEKIKNKLQEELEEINILKNNFNSFYERHNEKIQKQEQREIKRQEIFEFKQKQEEKLRLKELNKIVFDNDFKLISKKNFDFLSTQSQYFLAKNSNSIPVFYKTHFLNDENEWIEILEYINNNPFVEIKQLNIEKEINSLEFVINHFQKIYYKVHGLDKEKYQNTDFL